jgi:hypothetical protein
MMKITKTIKRKTRMRITIRITTDKSITFDHNLDINLIHEIDLMLTFYF